MVDNFSKSKEIQRGACMIHATEIPSEMNEPFVVEVTKDKVFYMIPADEIIHEMSMEEAKKNYLVMDIIPEELIEQYISF